MSHKKRAKQVKNTGGLRHRAEPGQSRVLELVLKGDVTGTVEAARASLRNIADSGVEISIIREGVGPVSKSDLFMAQTGSRLVVGFNVGIEPRVEQQAAELGVEVRLYDLIYNLSKDMEDVCRHLISREPEEKITGRAKVIATFKAGKGMIIGCEVTQDVIESGKDFRIITAMGSAYTGKIRSLQIEKKAVKTGKAGQQVGIHLPDWQKAKVGDLVECFERRPFKDEGWRPRPGVFHF